MRVERPWMVPAILSSIQYSTVQYSTVQYSTGIVGYPSPVKGLRVALLQRQAALVNVLQDVVFGHGQEVVHSHDVIHCLSQDPYLKIVNFFCCNF